jgi:hypothetical protein
MKAQVFEIAEDSRLSTSGSPHGVADLAAEVFNLFPDQIPPPNVWDLV